MAHGGRATTSHGSFRMSLVRPDELGETESACWAAFRRDAPEAASPFMSLTFARIVGAVRREARVAIMIILAILGEAAAHGVTRVDLGYGQHDYKHYADLGIMPTWLVKPLVAVA